MSLIDRIRADLDRDHPVIMEEIDGESIEIVGEARNALLDKWAEDALARAWDTLRRDRDALLSASDWTQLNDAPVDTRAWAEYRKTLRDLPIAVEDPTQPFDWPEPPK